MSSVRKEARRMGSNDARLSRRRGGINPISAPATASVTETAYRGTSMGPGFTIRRLLFTRPFLRVFFPAERGILWT